MKEGLLLHGVFNSEVSITSLITVSFYVLYIYIKYESIATSHDFKWYEQNYR